MTTQMAVYTKITEALAYEPYYVLTFVGQSGDSVKITILYDFFSRVFRVVSFEQTKTVTQTNADGYVVVQNFQKDPQFIEMKSQLNKKLGERFKYIKITDVYRHVSIKSKYVLKVQMIYSNEKLVNYQIHMLKSSKRANYKIIDEGYSQLPKLDAADLRVIDVNSVFVKDILAILR